MWGFLCPPSLKTGCFHIVKSAKSGVKHQKSISQPLTYEVHVFTVAPCVQTTASYTRKNRSCKANMVGKWCKMVHLNPNSWSTWHPFHLIHPAPLFTYILAYKYQYAPAARFYLFAYNFESFRTFSNFENH